MGILTELFLPIVYIVYKKKFGNRKRQGKIKNTFFFLLLPFE